MDIEKLIAAYPSMTDIHLTEDQPVTIRVYGELKVLKEYPQKTWFDEFFHSYLSEDKKKQFAQEGACDSSFSVGSIRCRLHLYQSGGKKVGAIRILPELSSVCDDPDQGWMDKIAHLDHGLVLITGPSGSGKSTTMARILQQISEKRALHVITLEDPIEYVIPSGKSLVHQREIGNDVSDFPRGIREALREDPDVIAVGEMRDAETIGAALTAAETGHLVLGTLHTTSAKDAVGRIIHGFSMDREREIRQLLSTNLYGIAAQKLYRSGKNTFLLREILTNVAAISHLIREGKEEQIPSYMEMGLHHMRTMKQAAYGLKGISERERDKLLKTLW